MYSTRKICTVKCDTSGRRYERYFVHFCIFFTTFRTKWVFFDWTTLKRFFVDHKDNIVNVVQTDTDADAMMEKETQNKETTKTTCYSSTKRWVEESNRMYAKKVEEDAKKMREKKKAHQRSDAAGVKKSYRQRFDGKGGDEDLSSSEAFERRIKRECEKILKRLKSSFNTSS